jgi:hypothetical protein
MKKNIVVFTALIILVALGLFSCNQPAKSPETTTADTTATAVPDSNKLKLTPELNIMVIVKNTGDTPIADATVVIRCNATGGTTDSHGLVTITEVDEVNGVCECKDKYAVASKTGFKTDSVLVEECGKEEPYEIRLKPKTR